MKIPGSIMLNRIVLGMATCAMASTPTPADHPGTYGKREAGQEVTRAGEQASLHGPVEHFTGQVRVDPLFSASMGLNASGAYVTFEPGARSAWHTHPMGQRLVVVSGVGLTQEWGRPVQVIRPGDVIVCPPGVKHWHGAAPGTSMTHLAVTGSLDGKSVEWMEKVTDEQYKAH